MEQQLALTLFQSKLQRALDRVRVVLNAEKKPCFAAEVQHQYEDKYLLAECLTNTAVASQLNCLASLGLGSDEVARLCAWAQGSAVSLQFRSEERCSFLRERTRQVEDPRKTVEELSVGGVVRAALTSKVVTTVVEYFWKFETSYELTAIRGVGQTSSDRVVLQGRTGQDELMTTTKSPPRPEARVPAALQEVNVSWLFRQLHDGASPAFKVDRGARKCHTPRRNPDAEAALGHFRTFASWAAQVAGYLQNLLSVQPDPSRMLDWDAVSSDSAFVPILPLLVDAESAGEGIWEGAAAAAAEGGAAAAAEAAGLLSRLPPACSGGRLPRVGDTNRLLAEESRQLSEKREGLSATLPGGDAVATAAEAILITTLRHCSCVCEQWQEALGYIENMLRKQLIDAIGKEVSPADFAEYMRFHNRKLFAEAYAPVPFCFAVRRSEHHSPEGTVSIEEEVVGPGGDSSISAPIVTLVARSATRARPMQFPLNASTNVSFGGDTFLHAWLSHKFSGQPGASLSLVARARQFSSMLVLVGRISSATTFDPKYAAIVQNKDELTIPLDLSTIPTPKEFKDAIESLSPEQQAFAKAFRAMQLESTLFGILVIQIKPQLEKVLNLPEDALTKEIKLTQDLMQLFIKFQIPSDLLSFDAGAAGDGIEIVGATVTEKLESVKGHVKAMQTMIAQSKQEEVAERRLEASYSDPFAAMQLETCGLSSNLRGRGAPGDRNKARRMESAAPAAMCMRPTMASAMSSAGAGLPLAAPAASPAPMPPQAPVQPAQPESQQPAQAADGSSEQLQGQARDFTKVPREMDERFEKLDTDSALRPTIISPAEVWTKCSQKALLASPTKTILRKTEQKAEKDAAFDLLDALTKSGALPVDHASLHIVVAATHCFDKTVTETVVQDNMNPIDKVERSTLIMATTVHQQPAAALIRDAQFVRVKTTSPMLFIEDAAE